MDSPSMNHVDAGLNTYLSRSKEDVAAPTTSVMPTSSSNLASTSVVSSNVGLSNTRQPYNTRHGDFCFGRLVDRHELPTYVYPSDLSRGSNGAPVREIGDFQR